MMANILFAVSHSSTVERDPRRTALVGIYHALRLAETYEKQRLVKQMY